MDDTVWCKGINQRIDKNKARYKNGRYIYSGVYCDTGEPIIPDEPVGIMEVHNKLINLDANEIAEVHKFIDKLYDSTGNME